MGYDYKPESAFPDIKAARANGWAQWNVDAGDVQWYRRANSFPAIHAHEQATADDDERGEEGEADTAAAAESRMKLYYTIVEQRAAGQDIDAEYGADILELAGKSMDDFNDDVAELQRLDMELER